MEDVVLHCPPQSDDGLSSILELTEKLLEPFPCRSPPLFRPWFTDSRLPIRPARPAPVIPAAEETFSATQPSTKNTSENGHADRIGAENHQSPRPQRSKDTLCVSETPDHLLCTRGNQERVPIRRSWSIVPQRELLPHSHLLSKQFDSMVSIHRLHLRQRAKWVITKHNCGNVEKVGEDQGNGQLFAGFRRRVWRALNRSIRSARLPTCNANIQRERAEIWVFCDVRYAEQVGRLLKEELELSGRILLSVHRLRNIFSM
ncbi:shieldin complex subunit 3 isoform X1 [Oryzias melastigma]|uniref:Shieldin complex subunit 3 n=1 Tax=Oryzias melastigma TaxID=30732 RepID=A0A3B3DCB3_ORYME|nr:shieldin complex subunit 3 isoform X1 [Oryzias melastigma]XP_024116772.1 shieldin complex subunit 3 isoform X1 [Oryzias melastigma]